MQVSLDKDPARYMVHAYDHHSITLLQPAHLMSPQGSRLLRVEHSLMLTPTQYTPWAPTHLEGVGDPHLEVILEEAPEVVLLGVGRRLRFPQAGQLATLQRAGIGVEVMDTAAACRTFNILSSEDRRVVAALIMFEAT